MFPRSSAAAAGASAPLLVASRGLGAPNADDDARRLVVEDGPWGAGLRLGRRGASANEANELLGVAFSVNGFRLGDRWDGWRGWIWDGFEIEVFSFGSIVKVLSF